MSLTATGSSLPIRCNEWAVKALSGWCKRGMSSPEHSWSCTQSTPSCPEPSKHRCQHPRVSHHAPGNQSHLDDGLDLPEIALRAALDDGDTRSKRHAVDVFPCVGVVQGAHDDVEAGKPIDVEAVLLDVRADGLDVDGGVECRSGASGDGRLGLFNVFFAEEELAVEVGEVDRVEIEQGDVPKPSQDDVFHCISFYQILDAGAEGGRCGDETNGARSRCRRCQR